jgi:hypothetical protein
MPKNTVCEITICKTADPWTTVTSLKTFLHVTMRQKANVEIDEEVNGV